MSFFLLIEDCASPKFASCPSNGECIPSNWVCNDQTDCEDGWDEQNCPPNAECE